MKYLIILLTITLLSCDISISEKDNSNKNKPGWLIMVYVSGTGNLEKESILNIVDMEMGYNSLSDKNREHVDIVVLHDRGSDYYNGDGDWTGTRLYKIEANRSYNKLNIISKPIARVDYWRESIDQEESMGNKDTLDKFITWAKTSYIRENSALIIWNHGGGLSGLERINSRAVSWDEEDSKDAINSALYIDEIQQIINRHYNKDNKLNVLGFDACLMGMVEIAYEFRDSVNILVASPAVETGGWRYGNFISTITEETKDTDLAKSVVSSYRDFSSGYIDGNTLSAIDLTGISALKESIDSLAIKLIEINSDNTKKSVFLARDNSQHYYKKDLLYDRELYPYIDLGDFIQQLEQSDIGNKIAYETTLVTENLKNINILSYGGSSTYPYFNGNTANGLSIFFSGGEEDYVRQWWYTDENTGTYGNIDFLREAEEKSSWKKLMDVYFKRL